MPGKPQDAVQARIDEINQSAEHPVPALTLTDEERGTVLSSPVNTAGSVHALIQAALLNTQAAVTSLESAGRDLFVQGRNKFFDTDLVGIPFMFFSEPVEEMREDKFAKKAGGQKPVRCFKALLLDPDMITFEHYDTKGYPVITGYKGSDPTPVDVEIAGAYVLNTLGQIPFSALSGRVWTLDYHPTIKTVQDAPARMLRYWKPASIEEAGTF